MEEEEDEINTFEYFNEDIKLLALLIILEGFYRDQRIFTLSHFLKGDCCKIEEISGEVEDTGDYVSVEELVLHRIIRMINDLSIGTVKRVSVSDLHDLKDEIIRNALKEKDYTDLKFSRYSAFISEVYKIANSQKENWSRRNIFDNEVWSRIDFTENDFDSYISYILEIGAKNIRIKVAFDGVGVAKTEQQVTEYLRLFHQDKYKDEKSIYKGKRFYFSKQIENFFKYVNSLPLVGETVNIPFLSLTEAGFEIIKILSYLEKEERIEIRKWNDTDNWNVKFNKIPITLSSILGQEDITEGISGTNDKEIKLNLSFSPQTGILVFNNNENEYKVKIQGQVQKEVLRAIFKNPKNTYTEWSLYDISNIIGPQDVNTTSVKNALYNINKKVRIEIPDIEKLFVYDKYSAVLNEKYVEKN